MAFTTDFKVEVKLDPRWKQLENDFKDAVEIAARHVETRAKDLVPVDTGATHGSIQAEPESGFVGIGSGLSWRVGASTEYAPFIEFGTIYMRERRFMIPAVEFEAPHFKRMIHAITQRLK